MARIQPIAEMNRRLPEHGRIRLGEKTARAMRSLDTFRFTSQDAGAIAQLAELYGGTVKPWEGQWEVVSEATEIGVVLPPECLSQFYELWSKGGCQRRCDGNICLIPVRGPDGWEQEPTPCPCRAEGSMACKPHLRLNVVLPELPFAGVWRLESKGWNAMSELPGMVEAVQAMQLRGFVRALLALEHRTTVSNGQTKKFVTPVLRTAVTLDALASGAGAIGALGRGDTDGGPVLDGAAGGAGGGGSVDPDDEDIVDAEIVDEIHGAGPAGGPPVPDGSGDPGAADRDDDESGGLRRHARLQALARECGFGDDERHALCLSVTDGRSASSGDLSFAERERLIGVLESIQAGSMAYAGLREDGRARVVRVRA